MGQAQALKLANRVRDAAIMGASGSGEAIGLMKAGNTSLIGTVNVGWRTIGNYLVPLAIDIFEGKPVPSEVHQRTTVFDATHDK
jgi:ABC-type sugar transport system substrate-binding protein